jgi:hypothetical protein
MPRQRSLQQRLAILGTFGDGFAKEVGVESSTGHIIQSDDQMVQGDCCA